MKHGLWHLGWAAALLAGCTDDPRPAMTFKPTPPLHLPISTNYSGDVGVPDPTDPGGPTNPGPTCVTDAECPPAPAGGCQVARCVEGACAVGNAPEGAACSDANACTTGDACLEGACVATSNHCPCQTDPDCAAFVVDHCAPPLVCDAGACTSAAAGGVTCPVPLDPCLTSSCDSQTGACVNAPAAEGTACDGGNPCMVGAACAAGACTLSTKPCDDKNACTADTCDATKGCLHAPADGACDDQNPCTGADACIGGSCVGSAPLCVCESDQDCSGEAFNPCLGTFTCVASNCALTPGSAPDCSTFNDGVCLAGACDAATGACESVPLEDGAGCNDGDPCTLSESCQGGVCAPSGTKPCDDQNPCTTDACKAGIGCVSEAKPGACDDGNQCTGNDACVAGACSGSAVVCPDGGPCVTTKCEPATGCAQVAKADGTSCDDGKPCFEADLCQGGQCHSGGGCACATDADCQEGANLCLGTPTCKSGECQLDTSTACPPAGLCQQSTCEPALGICGVAAASEGAACDDGNPCSPASSCQAGSCKGEAACDDQNPCTHDKCTGDGCAHKDFDGEACTDSDPCVVDEACQGGACQGKAASCDDGTKCTADSCLEGTGCVNPPVDCDDGSACTTDSCDASLGCVNATVACSMTGLAACEVAACDVFDGGCKAIKAPDGTPCDDGEACTAGDACQSGACAGAADCDDQNPCTTDSCLLGMGCSYLPAMPGTACDDGDACTGPDGCAGSSCMGLPMLCVDGDPCTDDECQGGQCTYTPNGGCQSPQCIGKVAGAACDDGDAGTSADLCLEGSCRGFSVSRTPGSASAGWIYYTHTHQHDGQWFLTQASWGTTGDAQVWSVTGSILEMADPDAPTVYANTSHGQQFSALHGGVAADADGKVWQWATGAWSDATALTKAIASSGTGKVHGVWTYGSGDQLVVWLVGGANNDSHNNAYLRRCEAGSCKKHTLNTISARPRAVTGYCETSGATCTLRLVLGADEAEWYADDDYGLKNHVFENAGGSAATWTVGYDDDQEQWGRRTRAAIAVGGGEVLLVGEEGYIRQRYGLGTYSYNLWGSFDGEDIEQWDFFGGWSGAGVIALAASRKDGDERVLELWTCPTSANLADADAWTLHTLATEPGDFAAVYSVWGTEAGEIRAVGGGDGDDDYSDGLIFVRSP